MSTQSEIVVSSIVSELLGKAVEAGNLAVIELQKVRGLEQKLLESEAELTSAQEDADDCDPDEERELCRRVERAHQAVRHAERTFKQEDDNAVFSVDMFFEAFHQVEVACRGNEPLHNELTSAQSRCQHPHFESIESLDSNEVRLTLLVEFLDELNKPEDVAFRNRLIAKILSEGNEVRYFGRSNAEVYRAVGDLV